MENIKQKHYDKSNLMVYVKTKNAKKFEAMSSLKDFTIAPNLMYAALFPYDKLERLKDYLNQYKELAIGENVSFQIRSAKDRKTVLYSVN